MPYSIMLDAGHGGRDPGAVYNGRQEKDDTLKLTLAVGQILEDRGLDVEYTRTTDIYETPVQKAREANEAGVDYFVSIHRNSTPESNKASGVESLVYDLSGIKYEMAQDINEQLEAVGFVNLGVHARPDLAVLRRTNMPAVLVEVGFINQTQTTSSLMKTLTISHRPLREESSIRWNMKGKQTMREKRRKVPGTGRGLPQPDLCPAADGGVDGPGYSGLY